jgi:hypothetical protein
MPAVPSRAVRAARRIAPLALEAWRRWERLPEEEKERYRQRARGAATRGRRVLEERRRRDRGRPGPGGGGVDRDGGFARPDGTDPPPPDPPAR